MGDGLSESHFRLVAKFMRQGTVVPFLGAGVNLCDRGADDRFSLGQLLPSGQELAQHLAREFFYPDKEIIDLSRVSQYVAVTAGDEELYRYLHNVFDFDYSATTLHRFLAGLPATLRAQGGFPHQLIVTTNYDDALERAFREAEEPYDLITYVSEGKDLGKCRHVTPDGEVRLIDRPNEYQEVSPEDRTVIAKIHGAVDRADQYQDSFVITEDNYIDYLTRTDITDLFPTYVASKLSDRSTHFLFLGYSLRDWNLRVILRRIWGRQELKTTSWAVLQGVGEIDRAAWRQRGRVEILETPLRDYVLRLQDAVQRPAELPLQP